MHVVLDIIRRNLARDARTHAHVHPMLCVYAIEDLHLCALQPPRRVGYTEFWRFVNEDDSADAAQNTIAITMMMMKFLDASRLNFLG